MNLKINYFKNSSSSIKLMNKIVGVFLLVIVSTIFAGCPPEDDMRPVIDLKAESIEFSVVKTTDDFHGVATIKATIKNIGNDFASGEGQQIMYLYERSLGIPTSQLGTEVARKAFTHLSFDQTLEVTFSRNWYSASPAEGEFPPEYILVIGYDPDLYIDGNFNNDDNNHENDELMVSGSGINALF